MSFETLATMTAQALRPAERREVEFIWHGGEPLLLGREYYRRALFLQQRFQRMEQRVLNSIQTNGTLLDGRWCEFLKAHRFQVGLSVDGPPEVHNTNRRYASGKGSFDAILRAIKLLRAHDLSFGALMVLDRDALRIGPTNTLRFFLELGITNFDVLPVRPDNNPGVATGERLAGEYVSAADATEFLIGLFDAWFELDDPRIEIRQLTSLLRAVVGASETVCTLAGNCLGQYFHVEPSGDVFHCDKFLDDPAYHLGNVHTSSFEELRTSVKFCALVAAEAAALRSLRSCEWFSICHGGCPHDRYVAQRHISGYDGRCCGQARLIAHIAQRVDRTLAPALARVQQPASAPL